MPILTLYSLFGIKQWVLGMKYFMEKTDEEMSSELRIEKNSVRMTLTRARNALKAQILKLM